MKKTIVALAVAAVLVGCTKVGTENVGVRTTFTGKVETEELGQGIHLAVLSDVDEFTGKEVSIELKDMQPKAADNLSLADMDVEIFYKVDKAQIADQFIKYANRHVRIDGVGVVSYLMVKSLGRESIYNEVTKYDSLQVHLNREKIAHDIKVNLQKKLDESDDGAYSITKVIVRNVKTDPSIEESIRLATQKNKELEAKLIEEKIADSQVRINDKLTKSYTREMLRKMELDAMIEACSKGNTCIIDFTGGNSNVVNMVGKR